MYFYTWIIVFNSCSDLPIIILLVLPVFSFSLLIYFVNASLLLHKNILKYFKRRGVETQSAASGGIMILQRIYIYLKNRLKGFKKAEFCKNAENIHACILYFVKCPFFSCWVLWRVCFCEMSKNKFNFPLDRLLIM